MIRGGFFSKLLFNSFGEHGVASSRLRSKGDILFSVDVRRALVLLNVDTEEC